MIVLFDDIAIEAAAKACNLHQSSKSSSDWKSTPWHKIDAAAQLYWKEYAEAALAAAEASLRERGMLQLDRAHENHFTKQWVNIGHGEDEPTFPVAIIRLPPHGAT